MQKDIPSPVDFNNLTEAREWERTAQSRPGRSEIFQAIAEEIRMFKSTRLEVLDLGSGPGFLADYLLGELPQISFITLLDFSMAMQDLARQRLADNLDKVRFVNRDFRQSAWEQGLGKFDVIVTNQAVHELRHKQHATGFHAAVKSLLKPAGCYLVSDHYFGDGGLNNDQLYMTIDEQKAALKLAGYTMVRQVKVSGSLGLHKAE